MLSHAILPKTALAKEIDVACAMATVALAASRQVCILIATSLSFNCQFRSFISTGLIGVVHSYLFFKGSYSSPCGTGGSEEEVKRSPGILKENFLIPCFDIFFHFYYN